MKLGATAWVVVGVVVTLVFITVFFGTQAFMSPRIDRDKNGASVMVLGCIDPRFANALAWHLTHSEELHMDYDLFVLAGAALGVMQTQYPQWRQSFEDHIGLAIKLHNIKEIWVYDHMDCGMYKATLNLKDDKDFSVHEQKIMELKTYLAGSHPELGFRGHIMDLDGSITRVV
jgi:carbonic anhydrase